METVAEPRPAQQPSYPVVFHYFWEHLNEEDIQSATCQREERETVNISQSIDWLSDNKTNPIST